MVDGIQTIESAASEPEGRLTITSLETVKVLSDPLRMQIVEELIGGPSTVKQLATQLGVTPTKLYYHINMLEEHGLIKVVSTRVVSGIIEKQYRVSAYSFDLDANLLSPTGSGMNSVVNDLLRTIFDGVRLDLNKSIQAGLVDMSHARIDTDAVEETSDNSEESGDTLHNFILIRNLFRLPPDRIKEFYRRVTDLMKELNAADSQSENEDDPVHSLLIALYPTTHQLPNAPKKGEARKTVEGDTD